MFRVWVEVEGKAYPLSQLMDHDAAYSWAQKLNTLDWYIIDEGDE